VVNGRLFKTTGTSLLTALALATLASGLALAQARTRAPATQGPTLESARQILLVVTDDWSAIGGTLRRFERPASGDEWTEVGSSVPVVVGRSGLAWGRGVRTEPGGGPVKREGDGKAPAGAYRLGLAFGSAHQQPPSWKVPYVSLGDNLECVDDAASAQYNRLVSKSQIGVADWKSSERMWEQPLYKWGLVVEHNTAPVEAAGGSCIFLHIWSGPARGTAGCTAMSEADLTATLAWLDPARAPLLVQLPRAEYDRLRSAWRLPR
jgi:D-alanyl-D-alanine dipeptidase